MDGRKEKNCIKRGVNSFGISCTSCRNCFGIKNGINIIEFFELMKLPEYLKFVIDWN